MADFSWVDKLDKEQQENLAKVIDAAEKAGVNPRLAAAIAYTESQLRHRSGGEKPSVLRGKAGEIGIMQIKPSTAKLVGFDTEKIMDTDANIEAGMAYLKQQLDRFNDPVLAAVAYNSGPDSEFLKGKGNVDPSPQSLQYANRVNSFGGFFEPTVEPTGEAESGRGDGKVQVDYDTEKAAALGALAGGTLGTTQKLARFLSSDAKDAQAASRVFGGATPGEKWAQKVTGYVRPGADTVSEAAQAYQRAKPSGLITSEIAKRYGPPPPGQPGVFTGGRLAGMTPPTAPTPPAPLSQQVKQGLQTFGGVMARSPVTTGALAGAGVAGGLQEAQTRYGKGDMLGSGIAGAGAFGSGMALIPTLPTRVIGSALATASPATLMLLDRMRSQQPEQAQRSLTNVDPMGNPLP